MGTWPLVCVGVFMLAWGCDKGDPKETDLPSGTDSEPDAGPDAGECVDTDFTEDLGECEPEKDDYQPRKNNSAGDTWPACISDDNQYHQIEATVSSIARVATYEEIGKMLWEKTAVPTPKDFVDSRVLFEEEQGLGSRVARRYDVHYPPPSEGKCDEEGIAEANPDYCVGPAILQPIIVDAFADGAQGKDPVQNAARIQAALQWFFYVSSIKEATTCFDNPKDCDSTWAYYTGGTPRDEPVGLAEDIMALGAGTHDRAFDGVLAVRCWRHLDDAVPAENADLQQRAIEQLDRALLRGMALLIRDRFRALTCPLEANRQGAFEALKILVPLFERETRSRDTAVADLLKDEIAKDLSAINVEAVVTALDATYPCP